MTEDWASGLRHGLRRKKSRALLWQSCLGEAFDGWGRGRDKTWIVSDNVLAWVKIFSLHTLSSSCEGKQDIFSFNSASPQPFDMFTITLFVLRGWVIDWRWWIACHETIKMISVGACARLGDWLGHQIEAKQIGGVCLHSASYVHVLLCPDPGHLGAVRKHHHWLSHGQ